MTWARPQRCFLLIPLFLVSCQGTGSDAADAGRDATPDSARGKVVRDASSDGQEAGQVAPELMSVAAWRSGATGDSVGMTLEGGDPNGDIVRVGVKFLDGDGLDLPCFDSDADGVPDSAEGSGRVDTPLGGTATFKTTAWFKGILQWCPTATRSRVWLEDAAGLHSEDIEVDIADQLELPAGADCNPTLLDSRCVAGLACMGQPAQCAPAVAPALTRFAYLQLTGGVRIAAEGTDPSGLLSKLSLDFLDAAGSPVSVDLDGDGTSDGASMDASCADASAGGAFALILSPDSSFGTTVKRMVGTPAGGGLAGTAMDAKLTPVATRASGAACDYAGFDACSSGFVCYPGTKGKANTCLGLVAARGKRNTGIPVLSPTGKLRASGVAAGASLWDVPPGCQPNDPVGMPEGVVFLHLTAAQPQLTVTTDLPGTVFDTAIYVVKNYTGTTPTILGCNDDGPAAPTSTLTLENLAAGDYLIVVDSFGPRGGGFEVRIIPGR